MSKLIRSSLASQRRCFLTRGEVPSQGQINKIREEAPEGYEWLADAMWKDGRAATIREILARDPMNYEQMVNKNMKKRSHPLHDGIKASFEKRIQYLKQTEAETDMPEGYEYRDGHEVPVGLTPSQERVFYELAKSDERMAVVLGSEPAKHRQHTLRDQYDNKIRPNGMTVAQIQEYNRQGVTETGDIFVSSKHLFLQLFVAYVLFTLAAGTYGWVTGDVMYR
eukprot:TRINITY_DN21685_c0_g1_i1.p1 TRINITY_DN21685_c0_g1~~TRINITY_DN21685_c0_g1_i1.p1  ORF type:complete len:223 (+),score=24.21 TRINITY_DN21685_c0_g1_i1:85-753(+)